MLKQLSQIRSILEDSSKITRDCSSVDLRSNLELELKRGTLSDFECIDTDGFIIYFTYTRFFKMAIFYDGITLDFKFAKGLED